MADKTDLADPSQAELRLELSRVLSANEFQASSQLSAFLRYIVDEELAGRGAEIKERNIAISALERAADFDPRMDCIVRVSAGRLRRALERYYAGEGTANPLRIEVPKGTYRPILRRVTAIADVISARPVASHLRIPTEISTCPIGCPVVAVVPFVTLTRGERERLLGDSIAEDISVRLSKFTWLRVVDYLAARALPTRRYTAGDRGAIARRLLPDRHRAATKC